ncbi:Polyketide biosynthesis malonyl CoA-acyl carrier protein transacylase BaeC [Bacillus velezensis]|nr:Polyketide biosynthesis malonyl CoA-acyl carrier protein transacylase BaeC [Bacillus velezensis]ASB65440.1 Polyketide biosynthesis malonyl CoA-acyl carrier protein transacylase BaeC [Bacillus velezensis]OBR35021.1 Polyketide biosynthesis malonyl CoA-acyl carrier protein transacylase BaeC [Bacillus velezensis]OCB94495.1 Polyketide biosynthesis malonyl CoA-acyl carrier protein transacylase BaeC [Bacillus velezensis]
MITYLFPGQGSQKQGMGSSLFDEFKDLTEQADETLGYSMKRLCLENRIPIFIRLSSPSPLYML